MDNIADTIDTMIEESKSNGITPRYILMAPNLYTQLLERLGRKGKHLYFYKGLEVIPDCFIQSDNITVSHSSHGFKRRGV